MNISFKIGRLTKAPEKVNDKLCKLSLAVQENYTDKDGNRPVQYFNVQVWNNLGERCAKYLDKGSLIAVIGKDQNHSYEKDGVTHYVHEIIATEIEFLSSGKKAEDNKPKMTPIEDDNLPF